MADKVPTQVRVNDASSIYYLNWVAPVASGYTSYTIEWYIDGQTASGTITNVSPMVTRKRLILVPYGSSTCIARIKAIYNPDDAAWSSWVSGSVSPNDGPCLISGTCVETSEGEKKVEDLINGDLIKTYRNGYKRITNITASEIEHTGEKEIKGEENKSLFILKKEDFAALREDLVLTGDHQLLVDDLESARQGGIDSFMKIDGKFGLRTYKEKKAKIYEIPGKYTVYDIAIGKRVYGMYANGLLVSSGIKKL